MKKEITDRIRLLGGNVANLKGNSLKEDLCVRGEKRCVSKFGRSENI